MKGQAVQAIDVAPQPHQVPEFLRLYETYTAGGQSIGAHMTALAAARLAEVPLLLATATDFVLYPGSGREPEVEGYRLGARGFKELAAVSHLGPAVATLVRMRELEPDSPLWRREAARLIDACAAVRAVNSPALWRDRVAAPAHAGRHVAIANMVDYACDLTMRYLRRALEQPEFFTAQDLREHFLEAGGGAVPARVPMNKVMIATFYLVALDTGHRVMRWFDRHAIDWSGAMALIVGQQGRPTAGVTWATNAVCSSIRGATRWQLPLERVYIAPHVPAPDLSHPPDLGLVRSLEAPMRRLWAYTREIGVIGGLMYANCPRFAPGGLGLPRLEPGALEVSELPQITHPEDWAAFDTRLRVIMEDPRQLLAGCVADYVIDQLQASGNQPERLHVSGLDGTDYPRRFH